ncbi:MAG: carboxypeptidase-like regulatory domain-containing protein [Gammaproteobacteria bacterium]|nr:carboxypeptidase-like regulatory domain-containing protein [Gammaproteobacteria bacterium]
MKHLTLLAAASVLLAACGGSSPSGTDRAPIVTPRPGAPDPGQPRAAALTLTVTDLRDRPISSADVAVIYAAGELHEAKTDTRGRVAFSNLPTGQVTISISAVGFESTDLITLLEAGPLDFHASLRATAAVSSAIVLGTQFVDRAANGSWLTFVLDVAVIDALSQPRMALTSWDFTILPIDCGWGGPRDCASDANGNATGIDGNFSPDGPARSFGLRPPVARRPYTVEVLVERSDSVNDWPQKVPALQSFFSVLGGNDTASLATLQMDADSPTLTTFGPPTNDGSTLIAALGALPDPAGAPPPMLPALIDAISRAAGAANELPSRDPTVLVLSERGLSVAEIDAATALARQLGVRVSVVGRNSFGLPELAVRTGGFVAAFENPRELGAIFDKMDELLAGTLPHYRMEFRISGSPGTFVSGGNAKVRLLIDPPMAAPSHGTFVTFDVAIP